MKSTVIFLWIFGGLCGMCLYCQERGRTNARRKMVGEWALEWLEKQMQRGLSQNTEGSYRQWICQRFVPEFSDVTLADLTEEHVQDFYESLAYEGLSRNRAYGVDI